MDHTLSFSDAVLGSMLLEQGGLCCLEPNMFLTVTTGSIGMEPIEAALLSNTTTSTSEVVKRWRQNQRDDRFAKRDTERALAAAMMAMMPIGITVMNKHHAFKFLKLFSVEFKEEDEEHTKGLMQEPLPTDGGRQKQIGRTEP